MQAPEFEHPLALALNEALGNGVRSAAARIDATAEFRHTSEADAVAQAVEKRRCEFATGRRLAHRLLDELGALSQPLTARADRAPGWPREAVGSISHTDDLCVVAVARASQCVSLGIDIEPDAALDEQLWPTVLTAGERAALGSAGGVVARAIFSAKECYWKLVAHRARRMLDFSEVEVEVDLAPGRFEARVLVEGVVHADDARVAGVSLAVEGWRLSAARA